MKNVIIICSDSMAGNGVVPRLLEKYGGIIHSVFIVNQLKSAENALKILTGKSIKFALYKFVIESVGYKLMIAFNNLFSPGKRKLSISSACMKYKIPKFHLKNVDEAGFLSKIGTPIPEYLISMYCAQIIPASILKKFKYAVNCHGSLLPDYRGVAPYFWLIKNGEKYAGITLHSMEPELDTGRIIRQERIPVNENHTVLSIHNELVHLAGKALCGLFEKIKNGESIEFLSTVPDGGKRYFMPDRNAFHEFKRKGKKLFRISEIFKIL